MLHLICSALLVAQLDVAEHLGSGDPRYDSDGRTDEEVTSAHNEGILL